MSVELIQTYRKIVAELTEAGGEFAVEVVDVAGVPTRVYANTPDTFYEALTQKAQQNADCDMVEYLDRRWTYGDIWRAASAFSAGLVQRYDIKPGDRVGIAMRNLPEWFVAYLGTIRIGAVAALINSRGPGAEMATSANKVGCKLVIVDDKCGARLRDAALNAQLLELEEIGAICRDFPDGCDPVKVGRDEPVTIMYTSGTTGEAKAAVLTQRNLASVTVNLRYLPTVALHMASNQTGIPYETLAKNAPPASILALMPLFHVSGLSNMVITTNTGGMQTILRRWDAAEAIRVIEKNKISSITGPTLVISELLEQPDAAKRLSCVRMANIGGQATPLAVANRLKEVMPQALQGSGWGMTELCGSASSASGPIFHTFPGCVGFLTPLVEGRAVDESGAVVGANQTGELEIRGAMVMQGYLGDAKANAEAFRDGRWFRTGDLGYFNEHGLLYIVDRVKDMVISAGENIYSAEIERVVGAHPDVQEVAMFGVPDERLGERAVAAVTCVAGSTLDEKALKAEAAKHLPDYKVPREFLFDMGALPRTGLGKVDKVALRQQYQMRMATTN